MTYTINLSCPPCYICRAELSWPHFVEFKDQDTSKVDKSNPSIGLPSRDRGSRLVAIVCKDCEEKLAEPPV